MVEVNTGEFLFCQKYRPKTVKDTILPSEIKTIFQKFVDSGEIPNLLLVGSSGVGKTTASLAMLEEVGADVMVINGSLDFNKDVLRDRVAQFVTTVSFTQSRKFVLIDEADGLSPATQLALRAFIEEYSHNAGFFLTANNLSKIIPALQSRSSIIEFKIPNSEKPKLAMEFMKRAEEILKLEGIPYEKKPLAGIIQKFFPDWRRILNEIQTYSASGKIDSGILLNVEEETISALIGFMKKKEFSNVRKWVGENSDISPASLFRRFYDSAYDLFDPRFVPAMVLILSRYSYQSSFCVDNEINTAACFAELMVEGSGQWKQ